MGLWLVALAGNDPFGSFLLPFSFYLFSPLYFSFTGLSKFRRNKGTCPRRTKPWPSLANSPRMLEDPSCSAVGLGRMTIVDLSGHGAASGTPTPTPGVSKVLSDERTYAFNLTSPFGLQANSGRNAELTAFP